MKTSIIKGYYSSYEVAYNNVSKRFLQSRKFSIQRSNEYKMHPWILIYYGKFA